LLEAAGLLHDVGYRLDPPNHAWMSAQLILDRGLRGFTDDERAYVAGTVLLHQRKLEYPIATAFIRKLRDSERAFRLAAYLRVADGLDHDHIQDVNITSVRRVGDVFTVNARPEWYGGSIPRAEVKADLWRKVFPVGIELRGDVRKRRGAAFEGVVLPGEPLLQNARRLLFALYRTILDSREQVLLSDDPAALHDLRVSMRRLRAALKFCGPLLTEMPSVRRLDSHLSKVLHGLGPSRDADVWCAFLEKPKVVETAGNEAEWAAFVAQERERRDRKAEKLKALLRSDEWRRTTSACGWMARVLLPQRILDTRDGTPIEAHAATQLREELSRIMERGHLAERTNNDRKLHELRRAVRRGRYWAEFAQPASDSSFGELAGRLKAVTHALGELHDLYLFTKRLGKSRVRPPAGVAALIRKRRKRWVRTFRAKWAALSDEEFRRETKRRLAEAQRKEQR
jgi:CHAD domain-containing protein